MKKCFRKIAALSAVLMFAININAQGDASDQVPPTPGTDPDNQVTQSIDREVEPVGTATLLLLGLGAGVLTYKVRKNGKEQVNA